MEVVAATPGGGGVPPFHDHDVREWSRIDSLTGVLERARLETDHWTANTNNSCHKYNKVVDSRARTNADGALQQKARRQLEVYQSQIPGGHLQVIKTHTVSSSRWSSSNSDSNVSKGFENLQLSLNPLDLSSQKSKASVGRGVGRRPPSRIRDSPLKETAATNLHRVSRLCHQIHEDTVKRTFGNSYLSNERQNGDIFEKHTTLSRTKSTSSEDLVKEKVTKSTEDLEDLEQLQSWRRTSKLRRSLQYPKQSEKPKVLDLPENSGSVRKIREELEKGRRLSTALRNNSVDLEALDQILQSISSSSSDRTTVDESQEDSEKENKKNKRNSFVTVESLQEVRGRLRRTSSPTEDIYKSSKEEETDDGIVIEEVSDMSISDSNKSRVRSYVFGMEAMMNKKPVLGTGSLESRTKLLNGSTNVRNEDWYNRRKSYGFEQVHNQSDQSAPLKSRVESSTDSGICRSSEIVKLNDEGKTSVKQISSIFDPGKGNDFKSTTITIPIKTNFVDFSWNDALEKRHSIAVDESKYVTSNSEKFRRTSLAINDKLNSDIENRKLKKVEFCKTEVHFAAESGKVNIVETDEKPPPTNNFRRRRRNSGPISDIADFERNGLPVLHFGDTSYEKSLLGVADEDTNEEDIYQNLTIPFSTVTVNTSFNQLELQEDDKKEENDNIKGILKNKPVKPTPYHLGENESPFLNNSDSDNGKWGIKLKPVQKPETPFWKSTVTLHNTIYNNHEKSEHQPEFQKLLKNLRPTTTKPDLINTLRSSDGFSSVNFSERKSWSDRVKTEDPQWTENKVYSTKVNFGDGGTAVVESDKEQKMWPKEDNSKDSKNILNKGLVVRIGREDFSKHTVCSKTTSQQDNTTTTTKITIDLSPSPTNDSPTVPKRSHSFKSTSLILSTIKNEQSKIPQQLEALKKLYDEDSDADKEVEVLMGDVEEKKITMENDNSSVVSGSWSRMRAYKAISEHVKVGAKIEQEVAKSFGCDASDKSYQPKSQFSPRNSLMKRSNLRTSEKLSSPFLVGRNSKVETIPDTVTTESATNSRQNMVLRQPKKSEMTYFGVSVSPKPTKKAQPVIRKDSSKLSEKPDLLQHMKPERLKPRKTSPEPKSPIYENVTRTRYGREFDSQILEELTKAADQILQAVNGFTDDDNRLSDEKVPLETISETKSWSQQEKQVKSTTKLKTKLKPTSSTSSIESISRETRKTTAKTITERLTKKKTTSSESSSVKATTKARRLQRASSREALLQSHGSSSEDLGSLETPQRKPRQIKKTKAIQLTITNGTPPNPPRRKREETKRPERTTDALPEIRHKTAVSTIRSTADKSSRDRSRTRVDDSKRRIPQKRETSKGVNSSKGEPKRSIAAKETVNHRISTASIKKCHRAEGGTRH